MSVVADVMEMEDGSHFDLCFVPSWMQTLYFGWVLRARRPTNYCQAL